MKALASSLAVEMPTPVVDALSEPYVYGGVGALAVGVILTYQTHAAARDAAEQQAAFTSGTDQHESAQRAIRRGGKLMTGIAALTTVFGASAIAERADLTITEKQNKVDEVAVVVDAGYEAFALDMTTEDGDVDSRIDVTVNSVNQLDLDGIQVNFIAAGTEPREMVSPDDEQKYLPTDENEINDRTRVVAAFREYTDDLSMRGSELGGGGNLEAGINAAEATGADKIIVMAGTLEGNDQSRVLNGEDVDGRRKVSIITTGQSGTDVDSLGSRVPAPINEALHTAIVGEEDSYTASSTSELQDIVQTIVDEELTEEIDSEIKLFEKIRNYSAAGLAALTAVLVVRNGFIARRKMRRN